jgi:hypothetical protein
MSAVCLALSAIAYLQAFGLPRSRQAVTMLLAPIFLLINFGFFVGAMAAVIGFIRKEPRVICVTAFLLNALCLLSLWVWQPSWGD